MFDRLITRGAILLAAIAAGLIVADQIEAAWTAHIAWRLGAGL